MPNYIDWTGGWSSTCTFRPTTKIILHILTNVYIIIWYHFWSWNVI